NDVKLLVPTQPANVFAMAGNYRSHVVKGATPTSTVTTTTTVTIDPEKQQPVTTTSTTETIAIPGVVPEKFRIPQPFLKPISSLAPHLSDIIIPDGATNVHYEAELVVVIGRTARNLSPENAMDAVFGVTCGNDVSERVWQKADVQWWRAKGSDTFGPCGPFLVTGIDYHNLMVTLRLNGKELQKESTNQLIHDIPNCVSFISKHTTLLPGDLIFMGTSGTTSAMKPGDRVEVDIEGVGVLQNNVVAE
ncbi:MAG: fumarylacetoacetate hydrolase family protein, partial [Planctomycetota bacterium]|nr:fumarylacetoacetate hydrolase family protein [Planctomycetota bacterium]